MRYISLDETDIEFEAFCEQYRPEAPRRQPKDENPKDAEITKIVNDLKGSDARARFLSSVKLRLMLQDLQAANAKIAALETEIKRMKGVDREPGEITIEYD